MGSTSLRIGTGPKAEPEGLLPLGFPASVVPCPLGTIENGKADVEALMIY